MIWNRVSLSALQIVIQCYPSLEWVQTKWGQHSLLCALDWREDIFSCLFEDTFSAKLKATFKAGIWNWLSDSFLATDKR